MNARKLIGVLSAMALLLGVMILPASANQGQGQGRGADMVTVCKYTGTPPGEFSHKIEKVARASTETPGNPNFADAQDSIVVEQGKLCPGENDTDNNKPENGEEQGPELAECPEGTTAAEDSDPLICIDTVTEKVVVPGDTTIIERHTTTGTVQVAPPAVAVVAEPDFTG